MTDDTTPLEALFDALVDLSPRARADALAPLTREHPPERLRELEALLRAHDGMGTRFEQPAAVVLGWRTEAPARGSIGTPSIGAPSIGAPPYPTFGAYEVVRVIGQGGMGMVYEAVRRDDTRQRVAIKTIAGSAHDAERLARFGNERRILAALQHRNIAALYDAAVPANGAPYVVMEYVDGLPIDSWCQQRSLTVRERVALFRQVCAAVQHAHGRLVVHRDLKPDNIFVTDDGTVKLLDFGIAKLLEAEAPVGLRTDTRGAPLTAAYAAPEQLRGETVGTAADVYALGGLLCRLLAGTTPFAASVPLEAFFAAVLHNPPPPPSRLATAAWASGCGVSLSRLQRELTGELDAIVLMALRKEPDRRYASAEALDVDLQHYLAGRPVSARPDTAWYRLRKFAGRQRALVIGSGIALLAVTVGTSVALVQRAQARRDANRARRVAEFLQDVLGANLVTGSATRRLSRERLTLREVLDSAVARVPQRMADDPEARAALHAMFGAALVNENEYARGLAQLDTAVALLRQHRPDSRELAAALVYRGSALSTLRPDRARLDIQQAVRTLERVRVADTSADVVAALQLLAQVQSATGAIAEAESTLHRLVVIERQRGPAGRFGLGMALGAIGMAQHNRGVMDSAETSMRAAAAAYETGGASVELTMQWYSLATHLLSKGRAADARPVLERAMAMAPRVMPAAHPSGVQLGITLADVYSQLGDTAAAHRTARVAMAAVPQLDSGAALSAFITEWWYARMLRRERLWGPAEAAARAQFARGSRVAEPFPHYWSDAYWLLGAVLSDVGKFAEAEPLLRRSAEIAAQRLGPTTSRVFRGRRDLAVLLLRAGRTAEAAAELAALPATTADSARAMAAGAR